MRPVRHFPTVRKYMTAGPHTIARSQSLATAHEIMREHRIRHLPVLEGGQVVGLVSQRDLLLVETLPGVNPEEVQVEDAMVADVVTASPDAPIGELIETMLERKIGSVVVTDHDRVAGVFTTIDALRALHELLEKKRT
jgi:acetoin utilization protein AcuB